MRFLLAMIGYASVATVLSAAIGLGYLWQTERLTDKRMFRIVALLHGVELNEDMESNDLLEEDVPPEELSLDDRQRQQELVMRNHEALRVSLERGRTEFDHSLGLLLEQSTRIDELATELKQRLEEVSTETADEGMKNVVRDLRLAKPEKAKALLLKLLESGGTDPESKQDALDEVVQLINKLPPDTWEAIINRFDGAAEMEQLHAIQEEQLKGGAKQRVLDDAYQQLGLGS